jgi:hypothetical protein
MRLTLGLFLGIGCAWAQSGIDVPSAGAIVDSSGALRQVQGVAGNFWLGPASMSGVLSAACSEQLCLVKTNSKILSATGEADAPPGPAIFDLSGDEAILFFQEPRIFARWHNNVLETLDWVVDGEVLSIRRKKIAVRRDGQVSIVHPDGSAVDSIVDATGPVLLLAEGVLFATPNELVLRHRDASEVRFELTGAMSITAMSAHYAAIHAGDMVYALRIDPGREGLYRLPGSTP